MPFPIGAAILGGTSLLGGILGGKGQRRAANDAGRMAQEDNRENRAFLTDIYNRNTGNLSPWMQGGQTANTSALGLLNLGGDPEAARSAFDAYRGSTGYDFRFGEGMRALDSAFSRNRESGSFAKSAMRFGQGIASDEFANYYNRVFGQSQQGLGAASALAGVGQNFGQQVVAGNQAATSAAANARLYAGNANANMWQNLGSSFGSALGMYGRGSPGFGGGSFIPPGFG